MVGFQLSKSRAMKDVCYCQDDILTTKLDEICCLKSDLRTRKLAENICAVRERRLEN